MGSLWRRLALVVVGVVVGMVALDGYLRSRRSALRKPEPARARRAEPPPAPLAKLVHDTGQLPAPGAWPLTSETLAIERGGAEYGVSLGSTILRIGADGRVYRSFSPRPPDTLLIDAPDLESWTPGQRGVLLDTIELLLAEARLPVAKIRVGPGLAELRDLLTRVRAPSR